MLTIAKNGKYLEKDGRFFPYLADTAWTLLQRLDRAEIVYYLDKRAAQGFNAVQVSAISELDGLREPNREGFLPFSQGCVQRPDKRYFSLLAFLADETEKRGMVLVLLPTWGDKFNQKWGLGPEIFTPDNAAGYGKYLAGLIGRRENVIWMLGGDRPIETPLHRAVIEEMAAGLRTEPVPHLMTYHPNGEICPVSFLRSFEQIDYYSIQSGHSFGGFKSEKLLRRTIAAGKKPVIDAECFYEDFPLDFSPEWDYRFTDLDIRRRIYKNMLTGAAGHTYGHQSVWCFRGRADTEYPFDWKTALDRPMANEMRYVNRLLDRINMPALKPDDLAVGGLSASGGGCSVVYCESRDPVYIRLKAAGGKRLLTWYDPSAGVFADAGFLNGERYTAVSPFENDALLLLETQEESFA